MIGFAIGLAVAIIVGAAEAMGDLVAVQIGLSGAAALDPLTQHIRSRSLGTFASLFAVTLLLSLNAHLVMIGAVAAEPRRCCRSVPPLNLERGLDGDDRMGQRRSSCSALRFAAPVIADGASGERRARRARPRRTRAQHSRRSPSRSRSASACSFSPGPFPLIGAFFTGWTASSTA